MQIRDHLKLAADKLNQTSDSPRLDAELLLCHCLDKPRGYLFTWPERALDTEQTEQFNRLTRQRAEGHPIAYLTGYREFWGLALRTTPDTLIPRPETELLVETALALSPAKINCNVLDLGTGSGAIALALASEKPDWPVIASDLSEAALSIARQNAQTHQLTNIQFIQSDWLENIPKTLRFDLIVSNPPYIADTDPHLQQGDLRFEPESALISGPDGLNDIRLLAANAKRFLKPQGLLMFEHGYDQGLATTDLMNKAGYQQVECIKDLSGNDRITLGYHPRHLMESTTD